MTDRPRDYFAAVERESPNAEVGTATASITADSALDGRQLETPNPKPETATPAGAARVAALRAECESWRGTPFRQHSRVKGPGGGVDCVNFVAACFAAIGAIPDAIAVPAYAPNHAEHRDDSLLRAWFDRPEVRARVRLLDEAEPPLDGDLVFPRVGRCEHHLAIRIGAELYHISRSAGWCRLTIAQLPLHRSRYRLMEAVSAQPSAVSTTANRTS